MRELLPVRVYDYYRNYSFLSSLTSIARSRCFRSLVGERRKHPTVPRPDAG